MLEVEEVSAGIFHFYRRYLKDPLRKDIESGHPGRALLKYLTAEETQRLPRLKAAGKDELDAVTRSVAAEVLLRLDSLTQETIVAETRQVLDQHLEAAQHIRFLGEDKSLNCVHTSQWVELSCKRNLDDNTESVTPRPARTPRVRMNRRWQPDYCGAVFPAYRLGD